MSNEILDVFCIILKIFPSLGPLSIQTVLNSLLIAIGIESTRFAVSFGGIYYCIPFNSFFITNSSFSNTCKYFP